MKEFQGTRSVSYKDMIVWKTFHDGFPDLFIKDVKEIYGKHGINLFIKLLASYRDYSIFSRVHRFVSFR